MLSRGWFFEGLQRYSYDAVMIDPPWDFRCRGAAGRKSPAAQYACMPTSEIAALPIGELLKPQAMVWLWCTWPLVAEGQHIRVLKSWGLEPKTGGAWAKRTVTGKLRWGTGYVMRTVCEPFIIATAGAPLARGRSVKNLIDCGDVLLNGLARQHSRKPDEAYSTMEALTPGMMRADLFSRQRRPGWDAWGWEAGKFEGAS